MNTSDLLAACSAAVALLALAVSIYFEIKRRREARDARRDDLGRAVAATARSHVLELLITSDAGVRSVLALDRGKSANERLKYLRRTAQQLDLVGEEVLASALDALCDRWESPSASIGEKDRARRVFLDEVKARFGQVGGAVAGVHPLPLGLASKTTAVGSAREPDAPSAGGITAARPLDHEKDAQIRVWVATSPNLSDATFLPFRPYTEHLGELSYEAWQRQAMLSQGHNPGDAITPPFDGYTLYRIGADRVLERTRTLGEQEVEAGEVWVLLPTPDFPVDLIRAQSFPPNLDDVAIDSNFSWREIQDHLEDLARRGV